MSVYLNQSQLTSPLLGVPPSPSSKMDSKSCYKKLGDAYDQGSQIWSYTGKLIVATRSTLSGIAKAPTYIRSGLATSLNQAATYLKLASLLNLTFIVGTLKSTALKIYYCCTIRDREGAFMNSLTLVNLATEVFDSTATFINTVHNLVVRQSIGFLAAIGLPLGYVMNGLGVVSRTIKLSKALYLNHKLPNPTLLSEKKVVPASKFAAELKENLGIAKVERQREGLLTAKPQTRNLPDDPKATEKLTAKRKEILARALSYNKTSANEAVSAVEALFEKLNTTGDIEVSGIVGQLKNIRAHLQKKINVDIIGILASMVMIASLALFTVGIATGLPFFLLSFSMLIRTALTAYENHPTKVTQDMLS